MALEIHTDNLLGFGCMRLPVLDGDMGRVNISEMTKMADLFLERGFTYFDTSAAYHNGHSEQAVHDAVVDVHPRDAFQVATKFPTFSVQTEAQVEGIFEQQLRNLGVDYVNFYLLHILATQFLRHADGSPGVVETCHLFEHLRQWQETGRAKHIGFSFHDTHEVLDELLTKHPEVEFVQIVINYFDWDSKWIQAKENLDIIRKHGKVAIAMEPVKGGFLADVPPECLELMHAMDPTATPSSWAVRFAASQPGVFKVLSGMSDMAQVRDNTATMDNFKPLNDQEQDMLFECARIIRRKGVVGESDYSRYEGLTYHGIPVDAILQIYNTLPTLPNPGFSADNNYLRQELLKRGVADIHQKWPEEHVELDGRDITDLVQKAWDYLTSLAM